MNFGDDESSSEEDEQAKFIKAKSLGAKKIQEKVNELDYAYDNVYDNMKQKELDIKSSRAQTSGGSTYMSNILLAKSQRDLDRQNLKDERAAKDLQIDNETVVFVSSSYKAFKEEQNELKAKLEAVQKSNSPFYQKLATERDVTVEVLDSVTNTGANSKSEGNASSSKSSELAAGLNFSTGSSRKPESLLPFVRKEQSSKSDHTSVFHTDEQLSPAESKFKAISQLWNSTKISDSELREYKNRFVMRRQKLH